MIPGPVFQFELLTTARRGRFYVGRAAYALGLLVVFWVIHLDWSSQRDVELTPNEMSRFALICFVTVTVAQIVLVVFLTPGLVAGVIADEKQRRTLHYLLASRLSGPEIVIGKLLARMLHVGVLVAVGFPVLSLLVLLGGIDPRLIVLACGAAASTAWFLAALSIWVSTIARKARDALFVTYGLEFLWLFIPVLVVSMPSTGWPPLDLAVSTLYEAWVSSSPFGHARQWVFGFAMGTWNPMIDLPEMIPYQLAGGLILAGLAALQLRPVFRAQEGGRSGRRRLAGGLTGRTAGRRWFRPALGDRPMVWKELFTSRARGFVRFVGVLITLIGGSFLAYYTIWFGSLAILEYFGQMDLTSGRFWFPNMHRYQFQYYLQAVVPLVYIAGLLSVAGAAAAAITSEHEQDTWTSLTATDLTGREIVLAKLLGALWRPRGIVLAILLMTLMGEVSGAIHWASFVPLCLALGVYGWFAAALGVWISLHLKSTWRAQFLTTAGLLLISLLGQATLSNVRRYAPLLWPGFTPYEISKCLLPPTLMRDWQGQAISLRMGIPDLDGGPIWLLIFWVVSLIVYLAGAIGLTLLSLRKFEGVAGRARRDRERTPEESLREVPA